MTGLLIALGIMVVMAMGVGCIVLEARLAERAHPARFFLCWGAWCVVAMAGGSLLIPGAGVAADEALLLGLMVGVIGYPTLWVQLRVDTWQEQANARWTERARARLTYRAKDFGGPAKATVGAAPSGSVVAPKLAAPTPAPSPLVAQPADSALARAVADTRPRWAREAEQGLAAVLCVAAVAVWLGFAVFDSRNIRDDGAPEAVSELLELHGFAAPKLKRQWLTIRCPFNNTAYRWSAMGARGLACVHRYDGEIRVKIERSWGTLPTVAFERTAIRPAEAPATVETLTPGEMLRLDDLAAPALVEPPASRLPETADGSPRPR